jgi:hypothetical protein
VGILTFNANRFPPYNPHVLRRTVILIISTTTVALTQTAPDLTGRWAFTQGDNHSSGTVVLYQLGTEANGTWHNAGDKSDADTLVAARMIGSTVMLTRAVEQTQQTYILTLSADGNRLDGVGQGALNHEKLSMVKTGPAPKKVPPKSHVPRTRGEATQPKGTPGPPVDVLPKATKQKWMGIGVPPQRGTYKWVIQSVALHGSKSGKKYSSFYYEPATGLSVEQQLSLPAGGGIVGVFPDDCMLSVQDQAGHSFTFRNESEAQARGFGPGMWSVYPLKCGGIAVYVK